MMKGGILLALAKLANAMLTNHVESQLNVWIPVSINDAVKYFNPRLGTVVDDVPAGQEATFSYDVSLLQLASESTSKRSMPIVYETKRPVVTRRPTNQQQLSLQQDRIGQEPGATAEAAATAGAAAAEVAPPAQVDDSKEPMVQPSDVPETFPGVTLGNPGNVEQNQPPPAEAVEHAPQSAPAPAPAEPAPEPAAAAEEPASEIPPSLEAADEKNSAPAAAANLHPPASQNATPIEPVVESSIVHDDEACLPKCTYSCVEPECLQRVEPDCEIPKCETRCPDPSTYYNSCVVECNEPSCMLTCPEDQYQTEVPYANNMTRPLCTTTCAEPQCHLKCDVGMECESICEEPKCKWKSKDPVKCPQPQCTLNCETAKACYKGSYDLPAVNKSHSMIKQQFKASVASWVTGEWSQCVDGKHTREVTCPQQDPAACGTKPATSEPCGDGPNGDQWQVSEWGECVGRCDTMEGHHRRTVTCPHEDASKCTAKRPHRVQPCNMTKEVCDECKVEEKFPQETIRVFS